MAGFQDIRLCVKVASTCSPQPYSGHLCGHEKGLHECNLADVLRRHGERCRLTLGHAHATVFSSGLFRRLDANLRESARNLGDVGLSVKSKGTMTKAKTGQI